MEPNQFQGLVRRILAEEMQKKSAVGTKIYERVPEVAHDKDYKKITPHQRDTMTKTELLDDMDKVVKAINKDYMVVWDDHDDISITAQDLFRIRVIPKWENNYCIEAFTRNEDRVYITGQSWDQVKEFVKTNLKEVEPNTEKAWNKNAENRKDKTDKAERGLSQDNKPKTLPLTNEPPTTSKNKDKNYTEDAVKNDDDLPDKPMREVGEIKSQASHKVQDPVKLRKRKPDTKLTVKQS